MNAFDLGRGIERRSRDILEPLLEEHTDGHFVYTDKGRLAKEFQRQYGDVFIQEKRTGSIWTIEIKAEQSPTGNLFLEAWSNGSRYTTGWMFHLDADLLFYHFLDSDELYVAKLQMLRKWFFFGIGIDRTGHEVQLQPGIFRFPWKRQKKYTQMNDTWGSCVPIEIIRREVGLRKINPLGLLNKVEP